VPLDGSVHKNWTTFFREKSCRFSNAKFVEEDDPTEITPVFAGKRNGALFLTSVSAAITRERTPRNRKYRKIILASPVLKS
jgi:hypothetical protein